MKRHNQSMASGAGDDTLALGRLGFKSGETRDTNAIPARGEVRSNILFFVSRRRRIMPTDLV
jgi:hypothetical protein